MNDQILKFSGILYHLEKGKEVPFRIGNCASGVSALICNVRPTKKKMHKTKQKQTRASFLGIKLDCSDFIDLDIQDKQPV